MKLSGQDVREEYKEVRVVGRRTENLEGQNLERCSSPARDILVVGAAVPNGAFTENLTELKEDLKLQMESLLVVPAGVA